MAALKGFRAMLLGAISFQKTFFASFWWKKWKFP